MFPPFPLMSPHRRGRKALGASFTSAMLTTILSSLLLSEDSLHLWRRERPFELRDHPAVVLRFLRSRALLAEKGPLQRR